MKKSPAPETIDGFEVYSTDQIRNASSDNQHNPVKSMTTSNDPKHPLMLGEKQRSNYEEELEKQILFEKQDSRGLIKRSSTLGS